VSNGRATPKTGDDAASDTLVFPGSNSLWITLAIFAVLAIPATLWVAWGTVASDGAGAATRSFLVGCGVAVLFALGAWFSWRQRREVVIDDSGVTIRAGDGVVKAHIPWPELIGVEERRIPSQPLQSAILLQRADGTALLIDPQQVRDTATMVREIRRHRDYIGSGGPGRRERR
jgi:hypothetical protein